MVSASLVKSTKYYAKLGGIRKIFITKKKILKDIELGINMSKLRSFEYWTITCSPREDVKEIVWELIG